MSPAEAYFRFGISRLLANSMSRENTTFRKMDRFLHTRQQILALLYIVYLHRGEQQTSFAAIMGKEFIQSGTWDDNVLEIKENRILSEDSVVRVSQPYLFLLKPSKGVAYEAAPHTKIIEWTKLISRTFRKNIKTVYHDDVLVRPYSSATKYSFLEAQQWEEKNVPIYQET